MLEDSCKTKPQREKTLVKIIVIEFFMPITRNLHSSLLSQSLNFDLINFCFFRIFKDEGTVGSILIHRNKLLY